MEQRKVVGNVNILDLRNATEESIGEYASIGNANLVLYTSETAHLLSKLSIDNINMSFETPSNIKVQLIMGPLTIGKDHFAEATEPLGLLVMGPVTVAPDVPAGDLDRGLAVAVVMGPVACPEPLAGLVQSKARLVMGPVRPYPVLGKMHLGSLVLTEAYLKGLDDRSELGVVGSVAVPEPLPSELIRRKLAVLHVTGGTTCPERNAPDVQSILTGTSGPIHRIPDGFKPIDREIELTRELLGAISDRRLYFLRSVTIAADVDASLFSSKIEKMICRRTLLYPESLHAAVATTCDLLDTNATSYEGELWRIDGETELHPSRFDYLSGKATLVVNGVLSIAPEVRADLLASRIAKVHNHGVIRSTDEQRSALEARLGVADGVFTDFDEESGDAFRLGNANYLTL